MATHRKDSGPGKEKGGKSPSNRRVTVAAAVAADGLIKKRSNSIPITSSSIAKSSVPNLSERRIPNYLKPTMSSTPDAPTSGKKQASPNATQPPSLNRRKSLDKLPSPSRLPKSHTPVISPEKEIKSLSHLKKSSSLPKLRNDKSGKALKDGGRSQSSVTTRTNNIKETTKGKKGSASNSAAPTTLRSTTLPGAVDNLSVEHEQENQETLVVNVVAVGSDSQLIAEVEHREQVEQTVIENNLMEFLKPCIILEHAKESLDVEVGDPESKPEPQLEPEPGLEPKPEPQPEPDPEPESEREPEPEFEHEVLVEETDNNYKKEEDNVKEESTKTQTEESSLEEPKIDVEEKVVKDKDGDGDKINLEYKDDKEESKIENSRGHDLGNQERVDEGNHTSSNEKEVEDVVETENKPEEKNVEQVDEGSHRSSDEKEVEDVVGVENKPEEKNVEQVLEGNHTSSNEKDVEDVGTENKPEEKNVAATQPVAGQGKKDSQAYNDVIEKTASKLMEKRRNKVRALVGAFETVISLQEPEG
ncbi:hypothetical protein NMG60_11028118 [Bertholletia excelsa]